MSFISLGPQSSSINIITRDPEKHGQKSCAMYTTSGLLPEGMPFGLEVTSRSSLKSNC